MVNWIHDFSNTYHSRVGRYPVIYTTTDWWTTCTGNDSGFGTTNPLWIARWASTPGTLPAGWSYYTSGSTESLVVPFLEAWTISTATWPI